MESERRAPPARELNAFDLEAAQLAPFTRSLSRRGLAAAGGDPLALRQAWSSVAFQAEGLAGELSCPDAATILKGLAGSGALIRHQRAASALLNTLAAGEGLRSRKVVALWVALDRADMALVQEARAYFHQHLMRALPNDLHETAADEPSETSRKRPLVDRDWHRILSLQLGSASPREDLEHLWRRSEDAVLLDLHQLRALSSDGLVAAIRAAAFVARLGSAPASSLTSALCQRLAAQAPWLDGWAASHGVCAAAALGLPPGAIYDPLRPVLLERCGALNAQPLSKAPASTRRRGSSEKFEAPDAADSNPEGLAQAERLACALATFDVHDAEVRERLAGWLLRPLAADRWARLALDLASAGLSDKVALRITKHVRARARSSEMLQTVGAETVQAVQEAFPQDADAA